MESEKVKEIKKTLEYCSTPLWTKCYNCSRAGEDSLCMYRLQADALTLINELESENERLKHLREVDNKTMTTLRQANTELNECMDEMQDRIAEMTKENERLKNRIATLENKLDSKESYYNAVKDRALEVFVQKIEAEIPDESTFGYLGYNGVMEVIDEKLKECLGK
jgi:chromosome segregation ATPase